MRDLVIPVLLFTTVTLGVACDDHDHGGIPECEAIVEACHPLDHGTGKAHECHEAAEAADATAASCQAISAECLAACGAGAAQTLYVAHEGQLVSYDLESGEEKPGTLTDVTGPTDLQALDDGHLVVNLTGRNEVLVVDGATMLEVARLPSSASTGTRPVHGYLSPVIGGTQYWMALNDGAGQEAENSARFFALSPASPWIAAAGEVPLGIGHHKAAFSKTKARVVISSIGDCDDVLSVYDFSDVGDIKAVARLTAAQAGWDGSDFAHTCDPTYMTGVPPAPHGCATSPQSGKAYCNLTGSGQVVVVDVDAEPPTFTLLETGGSGAGYTKADPRGRYVYTLGKTPREGGTGATCQIGQLAVVDSTTDTVVKTLPLLYEGPDCTRALTGTDEATAGPGHMQVAGTTLFVTPAGGHGVADARVRMELVVDVTDPANPVQLASIPIGTGTGHVGDTLSGDHKWLLTANNVDGTVTVIDTATRAVARTIVTKATPKTIATWGAAVGPSHQTGPVGE
jgi:YVTN family beta-propeller protein